MKFMLWLIVNAVALGAAAWLLDDIEVTADSTGGDIVTLLIVGLIFGVVTAVVRPVVNLLSLPLIILTFGLMLFVTNALMLMLTGAIADGLNLEFRVDGFWTAVWGAIIISIASVVVEAVLPEPK
jgi:putative membrane protein